VKIDSYSFGKIIINGKTYTSDVIIYPTSVDAAWWRKEGHLFHLADVETALQTKPELLIIGTGYAGVMRVPRETIDRIAAQEIEVKVERTSKAVEVYNELQGARIVIAALHITC
jgi:hypothetical protein